MAMVMSNSMREKAEESGAAVRRTGGPGFPLGNMVDFYQGIRELAMLILVVMSDQIFWLLKHSIDNGEALKYFAILYKSFTHGEFRRGKNKCLVTA
jgi:hypothetical protein